MAKSKLIYTPINHSNPPTPKETVESDGKGGFMVKKNTPERGTLSADEQWQLYLLASRLGQEGKRQQAVQDHNDKEALQFLEQLLKQ